MKARAPLFALLVTATLGVPTALADEPVATSHEPVIVFLVRHAEKADDSRDPALTAAGLARAEELARVLGPRLDRVHSTDFRRTRDTAAPTARALGVEVEIYDPRRIADLAAALRNAPGRHLVVGHSNTTPALVEALGGTVGELVTEEHYDRMWIVTLPAGGTATTVELRFGSKPTNKEETANGPPEP